jgi:CSLREA domain-containing protein
VVNSLADPGNGVCNATQCTLREAINDPASTEISFASGLTGPITLAKPANGGGTLRIEKTLTITGPSTGIVIGRRGTDPAFRILRIGSGVTVKLTNLTVRNGKETERAGGGIVNFGTLALTHCTAEFDSAASGGGIDNHGPLTLLNSTVRRNSAVQGGGGIANRNHMLTLTNSTVAFNSAGVGGGGGISNVGGGLALNRSTIADNSTRESGGGIFNDNNASATVTNSRIARNSAGRGGGIYNGKAGLTLTNSTVTGNSAVDGGGIANSLSVFIISSTVVGNSATGTGGGLSNHLVFRAPLRNILTNSTVSGNVARVGGGMSTPFDDVFGSVNDLTNSTVAFNSATESGGGIAGFFRLVNGLVARNTAPTGPDVLSEKFFPVVARFSLLGDGSGSGLTNGVDGNQVGSASAPIDPRLGPLALNGGPTRTHALLLGSPAIDAASTPDCPTTDQRGVLRPQGAACDIGSYERK